MSASLAAGDANAAVSDPATAEPLRGLFIDGRWARSIGGRTRLISCPADGSPVATVVEAAASDARAAVRVARTTFDEGSWPALPLSAPGAASTRSRRLPVGISVLGVLALNFSEVGF